MEEKFYYLRDRMGKPVITVCLLKENGVAARGIAVCSVDDNFCYKIGRAIARGRARSALLKNVETRVGYDNYFMPILRQKAIRAVNEVAWEELKKTDMRLTYDLGEYGYKAVKAPKLSSFETGLFK